MRGIESLHIFKASAMPMAECLFSRQLPIKRGTVLNPNSISACLA